MNLGSKHAIENLVVRKNGTEEKGAFDQSTTLRLNCNCIEFIFIVAIYGIDLPVVVRARYS